MRERYKVKHPAAASYAIVALATKAESHGVSIMMNLPSLPPEADPPSGKAMAGRLSILPCGKPQDTLAKANRWTKD